MGLEYELALERGRQLRAEADAHRFAQAVRRSASGGSAGPPPASRLARLRARPRPGRRQPLRLWISSVS